MNVKQRQVEDKSVVKRVADQLREEIFRREDGECLGSLEELLARFDISYPSFRQAARMMEQEQLLTTKRGVGGGFFARRPSASMVAHTIAVFLSSRRVTVADAVAAAKPLFCEIARLAARKRDAAVRQRFEEYIAAWESADLSDARTFLLSEKEFQQLYARASGNGILELYTVALLDMSANFLGRHIVAAAHTELHVNLRFGLMRAIIGGDEELATMMAGRRSDALITLIQENALAEQRKRQRKRSDGAKLPETQWVDTSQILIRPSGGTQNFEF